MTNLSGRSAIVTGGFSGMGFAIATALAQAGANVAVGSYVAPPGPTNGCRLLSRRRRDRARPLGAREQRHQGPCRASRCARQRRHRPFRGRGRSGDRPGRHLVNAAGTTAEQPVCGHSDELWDKIVDTNLTGAFRVTRAVLPGMIERGWGRIINIGSTAASVGWKDNPAYCASKAGLLGLTRCVALEGAPHGVTCVMISPTWVETELMRRNVAQVVAREGKGRAAEEAMAEDRKRQSAAAHDAAAGNRRTRRVPLLGPRQGHHHGEHPDHRRSAVVA